jgi:hypothetical protein
MSLINDSSDILTNFARWKASASNLIAWKRTSSVALEVRRSAALSYG